MQGGGGFRRPAFLYRSRSGAVRSVGRGTGLLDTAVVDEVPVIMQFQRSKSRRDHRLPLHGLDFLRQEGPRCCIMPRTRV